MLVEVYLVSFPFDVEPKVNIFVSRLIIRKHLLDRGAIVIMKY